MPFVDNIHNAAVAEATPVAATAESSADIRDHVVTDVPPVATNVPPADHDWEAPDNDIAIEPPGTQTGAGYGMDLDLVDKKDRHTTHRDTEMFDGVEHSQKKSVSRLSEGSAKVGVTLERSRLSSA